MQALYLYAMRCNSCRVRQILEYFGEEWPKDKGGCGTCDCCVKGVRRQEDYFREAGTLLDAMQKTGSVDRQSCWTQICKDLDGKCNRGKHFWRGFCRQMMEQGYVFDDGMPSDSQARNSVITIACPQPTRRGLEVLNEWRRLTPAAGQPGCMAGIGTQRTNAATTFNSASSLRQPFRAPRPGLQEDLGSWRVLSSLNGEAQAVLHCSSIRPSSASDSSCNACSSSHHTLMMRPEGDMLPPFQKKGPSPWADPQQRAAMLSRKRAKGGGGRKSKKRGKSRKKGPKPAFKTIKLKRES